MPKRVQRKRTKGWRMPPNTVSVTRPGTFGNPFRAGQAVEAGYKDGPAMAVWAFREWMRVAPDFAYYKPDLRRRILERVGELRGKNLACFCSLDQPCHADVLLELANET